MRVDSKALAGAAPRRLERILRLIGPFLQLLSFRRALRRLHHDYTQKNFREF